MEKAAETAPTQTEVQADGSTAMTSDTTDTPNLDGTSAQDVVATVPLEATPEWLSYAAAPTGAGLGSLVAATPVENRGRLVEAVERLFFVQRDWRIAQHAALLHLDRFAPHTDEADLVKALCFADHACSGSNNDPRARLLMGSVNWHRRLPLAVFYDVDTARAGEARLRAEASGAIVEKLLGEAFLLEGLARAYLRDVDRARDSLIQAERRGGLTVEAVVQLLVAAEPDFPEASMWAAELLPSNLVLAGRAGALQVRAQRRRLLSLLCARGADDRG